MDQKRTLPPSFVFHFPLEFLPPGSQRTVPPLGGLAENRGSGQKGFALKRGMGFVFNLKRIFGRTKNDIIFGIKFDIMAKAKTTYTEAEIGLLADAFERDTQTIKRWIKNSDDRLTSDKAKNALKKKVSR